MVGFDHVRSHANKSYDDDDDDDELNINPPTPCQQQAPVQTKTQRKWPANQDPKVPGQRAHGGGCARTKVTAKKRTEVLVLL